MSQRLSHTGHLSRRRVVGLGVLAFLVAVSGSWAMEPFKAPEAYPVDRYEAGWQKNPFTLRTAPTVVERESFAKDLVLHNSYSIGDKRTVILANKKTRERLRLSTDTEDPSGIAIQSYHQGTSRKDSFVVLERGGETAMVRSDEAFLKQMLAGGGGAAKGEPEQRPDAAAQALAQTNPPAAGPPVGFSPAPPSGAPPAPPIPGSPMVAPAPGASVAAPGATGPRSPGARRRLTMPSAPPTGGQGAPQTPPAGP